MKDFFRAINWKQFLKFGLSVPAFFTFVMLCVDKQEWWNIPVFTALWNFMLLISLHSKYMLRKSKKSLTIKDTRKKKLIKIKRYVWYKKSICKI
jgi:hypothetical protein